jgi:glucokinase
MAGEIGHMIVAPDGPRCACGLRGCLEAVAAGPAIERAARAMVAARPPAARPGPWDTPDALSAEQVYVAAAAGDELALAVTGQAGRYLAQAIHALVMTCDVERVVVGGGVARAGAAFLDPVLAALALLRQASPLAAEVLTPGLVGLVPAGYDAALWGAWALTE